MSLIIRVMLLACGSLWLGMVNLRPPTCSQHNSIAISHGSQCVQKFLFKSFYMALHCITSQRYFSSCTIYTVTIHVMCTLKGWVAREIHLQWFVETLADRIGIYSGSHPQFGCIPFPCGILMYLCPSVVTIASQTSCPIAHTQERPTPKWWVIDLYSTTCIHRAMATHCWVEIGFLAKITIKFLAIQFPILSGKKFLSLTPVSFNCNSAIMLLEPINTYMLDWQRHCSHALPSLLAQTWVQPFATMHVQLKPKHKQSSCYSYVVS